MQWAKGHVHVKYNLAASGVMNYPLSWLPARIEELEITGNSFYGYPPLQEALAHHCAVATGQVFSALGTSFANHIAMAALLEPGDEVLIEEPTYELLISTARYLGARVKRFPRSAENEFQIIPKNIQKVISKKTKLIVITNLHNPSSALTDEKTLRHIGQIARSVKARVLVDEVYLDAAFEQSPRSAIHLGKEFIVTGSLTKVYGLSGLRCGWVLAEPKLVKKMWLLNDLFASIPPHPSELLSVIALQHLDTIRTWSRSILSENQNTLRELFLSRKDIQCFSPGFGIIIFPRLLKGKIERLASLLTQRYDTAIAPGKYFEMREHFRVGFGCKPELFRAGLQTLCRALDEL
jgi:aspartate/methionine/tyrosine aminotransferase